jgi:hypothetical protein
MDEQSGVMTEGVGKVSTTLGRLTMLAADVAAQEAPTAHLTHGIDERPLCANSGHTERIGLDSTKTAELTEQRDSSLVEDCE